MVESEIARLIADLEDSEKPTIRAAVDALVSLAAESRDLRDLLNQRLNQSGDKASWPFAYILAQLPEPPPTVVQTLLDALDYQDADIRWAIALSLVALAKRDANLIKLLIGLCERGSVNQKRMAIYCLRDLALMDSASLLVLLSALNDCDATVRVAAVIALKERIDADRQAKNRLLEVYLTDPDARVRNAAAITLASLEAPTEEFLAVVRQNITSKDAQTRKAAAVALQLIEKRRSASTGGQSGR